MILRTANRVLATGISLWLLLAQMLVAVPVKSGAGAICAPADACGGCGPECQCCLKSDESGSPPLTAPVLPASSSFERDWSALAVLLILRQDFAPRELWVANHPVPAIPGASPIPIYQRDCGYLI